MALQGCRVVCLGGTGMKDSLRYMATTMGATTRDTIDYSCTHLVSAALDDTVAFTQSFYPWIRIVHVRWVAKCWMRGTRAREHEYELAFYLAAKCTGTSTRLSCRNIFFAELDVFHAVEVQIAPLSLTRLVTGKMDSDPRRHTAWPLVCAMLQDTAFWGHMVRDRNWGARRAAVMALSRADPSKRRWPRVASDGPAHVLLRVARLPPEMARAVIEYL